MAVSLQVNVQVNRCQGWLFTGGEQRIGGGVPCHSEYRDAGAAGGIVEG